MLLVVRGTRVALPGALQPAAIVVGDGRIVEILAPDAPAPADREIDAGDFVVMPGLVDTHVHINEPGRTEWEGFDHATRAAAAGGVTTLVDMPLNSIPATTTVAAAGGQARRRGGQLPCRRRVLGRRRAWQRARAGAARARRRARVQVLSRRRPASTSSSMSREEDLREALPVLARLGLPLLAHAELPALHRRAAERPADPREYGPGCGAARRAAEHAAIELLIALAREYGARIHIVHSRRPTRCRCSRRAGRRPADHGRDLPALPDVCCRGDPRRRDRLQVRAAHPRARPTASGCGRRCATGDIDFVATDIRRRRRAEARRRRRLPGGVGRHRLAAGWGCRASGRSVGARHRRPTAGRMAVRAPARLAGLAKTKGRSLRAPMPTSSIWDPEASWTVDPATLYHRHPVTPYAGVRLRGLVRTTIVRGEVVFEDGVCRTPAQAGCFRSRDTHVAERAEEQRDVTVRLAGRGRERDRDVGVKRRDLLRRSVVPSRTAAGTTPRRKLDVIGHQRPAATVGVGSAVSNLRVHAPPTSCSSRHVETPAGRDALPRRRCC